jgi:hypothetical protein
MAHMDRLFQRPDKIQKPLYVITTVFNSMRFRSRWKLYEDFITMCENTGAIVYTVEVAFGEREFAISQSYNPCHIQLRTLHELWLKENAVNIGVSRLPSDWSYVAWIDADIQFVRPDWADETIHKLQHYPIVQMWSECYDLDKTHKLLSRSRSLADCHVNGVSTKPNNQKVGQYVARGPKDIFFPHPGYAWAARREAWDAFGGLIDWAILGSADSYMAHALVGQIEYMLSPKFHPRYKELARQWQERTEITQWAERPISKNLGVVDGLILHNWHGSKDKRRYSQRWNILADRHFNPDVDIKRDWQGLYQLTSKNPQLRRDIQHYFAERDEDA